jgi:hypothetical protein
MIKMIIAYLLTVLIGGITIYVIENKIPEHYKIKKWWRKHIIGNDTE